MNVYRKSLENASSGPESCGFWLEESQTERFRMVYEYVLQYLHCYTLLDVGCGTGDFYNYLDGVMGDPPADYLGIDTLPEMVYTAQQNTDQEIVEGDIRELDRLPIMDVSVALAVFTQKDEHADQAGVLSEIEQILWHMAEHSRHAVVLTCLSTWKTDIRSYQPVVDPGLLWSTARRHWERVNLIGDYAPHDVALIVRLTESQWRVAWRKKYEKPLYSTKDDE